MIIEKGSYDLESYLESDVGLSIPGKARLCIDIIQGLQALHKIGIVHGDLQASSILLVESKEDGRLVAKIADIGSSSVLSSEGADSGSKTIFLAPERLYTFRVRYPQLEEWGRKHQQDIYGFGLLVWQIAMNGEQPYSEVIENRLRPAEVEDMKLKDINLHMLMEKLHRSPNYELAHIVSDATNLFPDKRTDLKGLEDSLKRLMNSHQKKAIDDSPPNATSEDTEDAPKKCTWFYGYYRGLRDPDMTEVGKQRRFKRRVKSTNGSPPFRKGTIEIFRSFIRFIIQKIMHV
jgi:serine/threonine protein kinase